MEKLHSLLLAASTRRFVFVLSKSNAKSHMHESSKPEKEKSTKSIRSDFCLFFQMPLLAHGLDIRQWTRGVFVLFRLNHSNSGWWSFRIRISEYIWSIRIANSRLTSPAPVTPSHPNEESEREVYSENALRYQSFAHINRNQATKKFICKRKGETGR